MLVAGRKRRTPSRGFYAVLRFIAAVMTTSGILLLADAGLTLAWQEPVSALIAQRQQSQLEDAYAAEARGDGGELSERRLQVLARRHARRTDPGEAWGRIVLPKPDRDFIVVEGTEEAELRQGPGHYPETGVPGQVGTVAIAGHRTTYGAPFRTIDRLDEGDEIIVELPWARFTYVFDKQKIVPPTKVSVIRDVRQPRLVLSACHPLYSAAERIVVFATLEEVEPLS